MRAAMFAALALAACDPFLAGVSVAPPGRTARLDEVKNFWGVKSYRLELSRGVAFALTCNDSGPCEHATLVADDPSIIEVRPASLGVLERAGIANRQQSTALVLVGKKPGTTQLHLRAKEGKREIAVTVVPEPAPRSAARAAVR